VREESRLVGDDAVDARLEEPVHLIGIVDGVSVDADVGLGQPAVGVPLRKIEVHDRLERLPLAGHHQRKAEVGATAALQVDIVTCNKNNNLKLNLFFRKRIVPRYFFW
jgi:hypothetical protein